MEKHILVTNDDGVLAPGLFALVKEMRQIGKVSVLAPDRNWSGGGHVKTLDRALRVRAELLTDGTVAYASDGAPSDCVSLEVPEGYLGEIDYGPAAHASQMVAWRMIENGLPPEILLNVNVPFLSDEQIHGFRLTRLGLRVYHSRLDECVDPRDRPYYWIGGDASTGVPERGTDIGALAEGFISVTPLQLDLTAYHVLTDLNSWSWREQPQKHIIHLPDFMVSKP